MKSPLAGIWGSQKICRFFMPGPSHFLEAGKAFRGVGWRTFGIPVGRPRQSVARVSEVDIRVRFEKTIQEC